MTQSSASVVKRNEGNKFYDSASASGIGNTLRKGRLQDAIQCYNRAQTLACNQDEFASAAKNLGKASWKLAQLLSESNKGSVLVIFHLKEAIHAFDASLVKGEACKSVEWKSDIWESFTLCFEDFLDTCDEIDDIDERVQTLSSLKRTLTVKYYIVQLHLKIANSLFHDGVKKVHENDFSRCLSRMKDCYYPIEEAKRLSGKSEDEESEINVIQKDVYYTTCTAESIQAREMGSQLLDIAVQEEEVLDVEAIWDVIDWYTRAAILARELDLEQEAIALSRLGFVYNKVLKLKQRSKLYYKKSFELAESMKPRVFTMHDWYKHCVSTLQEFQMEERMWDESEKQKERDKKLEELKEEIADLKLHNKGKTSFLAYVYKTFPPKNPKFKKPEDDEMKKWEKIENDPSKAKELGKILLKGLTAYHPDKVDMEKHGEKWKTLSEEITKMLTAHYETTKLR